MTIEVYSQNSTFDIVPLSPMSTVKLDIYYNTAIKGCAKKCPCRTWINCHYYNNSRWKKLNDDEEVVWTDINEWYDNFFKYKPGLPDTTYLNG